MWTDTAHALHARTGLALPSDLTDAEWAVLEPWRRRIRLNEDEAEIAAAYIMSLRSPR